MAKKALVAYFSASGVTAALAKRLADAIGADLHEIQPEVPYTKEDLDWMNKNSRSSRAKGMGREKLTKGKHVLCLW